jgi:glucokinase
MPFTDRAHQVAIALDIGGTYIKYALVHRNGSIIWQHIVPTATNGIRVLDKLKTIVRECVDYVTALPLEVIGIGIGVPSIVDNGEVLFANNLSELNNQHLPVVLDEFQLPVWVDNDANLMGLAEVQYGAAKGFQDVVFLVIGTGVGGALILNGQLYGGFRNRGTELGHIIVEANGNECTCGTARGCMEAYVSVNALLKYYKSLFADDTAYPSDVDGRYIVARYLEGQYEAVTAMSNHFYYMAVGIASFINVFAPQKIIIGGGISESGDFYIDNIRTLAMKMAMKETSQFTVIERATLGNKAGFMGAAALVFSQLSPHNKM